MQALPGRTHVVVEGPWGAAVRVVEGATGMIRQYPDERPSTHDYEVLVPASADGSRWAVGGSFGDITGFDPEATLYDLAQRTTRPLRDSRSRPVFAGPCSPQRDALVLFARDSAGEVEATLVRLDGKHVGSLGPCPSEASRLPPVAAIKWSPDGPHLLLDFSMGEDLWVLGPCPGQREALALDAVTDGECWGAWWLGNEALLYEGPSPTRSGKVVVRADLAFHTRVKLLDTTGSGRAAPWPVSCSRPGSTLPLEVLAAAPEGRWFVAQVVWADRSRPACRVASWLRSRAVRWRPLRPAAAWLQRRILDDEAGLFVFDRDGKLRWKLPVYSGRTAGAAFLADGRIAWSDGDVIRVGDPSRPQGRR